MSTSSERPFRHPEKRNRPDSPIQRKPAWIRVKAPVSRAFQETRDVIRDNRLVTVCEEAACPNIGECWAKKHATMMIMGDICTRACAFCNVATGKPAPLNALEPFNVAAAVEKLGLEHVVITSVDRDDLADGGAAHFAAVIEAIRTRAPQTTIEVLTPDFKDKAGAVEVVVRAQPDVFNHNLETVPRLYPSIRPGARYFTSLELLSRVKALDPAMFTKSGIMVGLGETREEVSQVMDDMRAADVDFLTIGQYLQPTPKHAPIDRFVTPDEFDSYAQLMRGKGFLMVSSTPLTRSSYHAGDDFARLRAAREQRLRRPLTLASDQASPPMPTHAEERWLPYPPEKLFDLVADVERYPEFLPWCVAARLRNSSEHELLADMVIGFKGIREKFTSRVSLDRPNLRIHVSYEEGPFKYLNNHWYFRPSDDGTCVIDFFVDFEFRSRILQKMMALLFNEAVRRMVAAFEARAKAQFGPPDPSVRHQP